MDTDKYNTRPELSAKKKILGVDIQYRMACYDECDDQDIAPPP